MKSTRSLLMLVGVLVLVNVTLGIPQATRLAERLPWARGSHRTGSAVVAVIPRE